MKKISYIIFISVTVLVSFGFKGCDQAYCEFLYNLNSAVGRFEFNEGEQFFAVGEEGIDEIELSECFDTIYSVGALSYITSIRFNVESGTGYYCAVGNAGNVQFSADGGQTWENRSISGLTDNLLGLDFLNYGGPDLPVVVCGEAGTMYTSTNSGSGWTWEKVNTTTTANLNSVIAINKSLFITVGDNGTILKTYDQGKKWENHTVGGAKFNSIFDGGKVQVFGYLWIAGDNGRIYATTNYGISWFPQVSGVTDNLNDIKFRNQTEGIVVGDNGVVRYTTNGGTTWLADPYFNGLTNGDILSISTVNNNTGTAIVRNTTSDGGTTSTMFIVSSEPLSADDDNNVIPSEYYLEQNYPNPFNPSTTISWQMPVGGKVKLIVLDILGRPVAELVNEFRPAGSYQVEFSAKAGSASGGNAYVLPSGIYFYQLSVGDEFLETKKLVLMK